MQKLLCALIFVFASYNSFAIDPSATFTEDDLKIYEQIESALKLPSLDSTKKKEIIEQFEYALSGEWYSWWLGNEDLADSKFIDNEIRFYDLIVTNSERIHNISFTYFPAVKQIYYTRKEYVYSNSDEIIEAYEDAKKDEELEMKHETDNFAFFKTKGYVDFSIYHVDGKEAMISYIDAGIIELD